MMRYFATALPGLAPILREEIEARLDAQPSGEPAFDGRNDVVSFEAKGNAEVTGLRTSEDVFVEAARARRRPGLEELLRDLWHERDVSRALSVYASQRRPLRTRMSFHVVARVLSERQFLRTELRDGLARRAREAHPRWRASDPADLELWVLETNPGVFRLGIRLTTAAMRHRGGRAAERPGALRPTVAAAMVFLAGPPRGRLLDAFCGSGTILREAGHLGWDIVGSDIDPEAVKVTNENLAATKVQVADARNLPLPDRSVHAVVSNLPFGAEYALPEAPAQWFADVLRELVRVAVASAPLILLMPPRADFRAAIEKTALQVERRLEIRLLGFQTAIWQLRP